MSRQSESIKDLATALALAQGEMENPAFDTANPFFKSRYASLAAVLNTVRPVLAKHGIGVLQDLYTAPEGVACVTTLSHSSGEWWESSVLVMPVSKPDAQGFGSAATYARRYALQAVVGVAGEDDDDAESAVRRQDTAKPAAAAPAARPVPPPVTPVPVASAPATAAPTPPPLADNAAKPEPTGSTTSVVPASVAPVVDDTAKDAALTMDSGPCVDCGIVLPEMHKNSILNRRKRGEKLRWSHQSVPGMDKFKDAEGKCNHPEILKLAGQTAAK
jgi:hypothetical protein